MQLFDQFLTRSCFKMTNMIKVCSNVCSALVSITNTRTGEVAPVIFFVLNLATKSITQMLQCW
jgi:hypothetical protein